MKLTDLAGEKCLACGEPLPEDARSNRIYCSKKCMKRYYGTYETAAIRRSKRGRKCVQCGGPISVDLQASAIYCGILCQRAAAALRRLPPGRPCARCGEPVPIERLHAITCSEVCRRSHQVKDGRRRRSRTPIPCAFCGQPFLQKKNSNSFCSLSCAARGRVPLDMGPDGKFHVKSTETVKITKVDRKRGWNFRLTANYLKSR